MTRYGQRFRESAVARLLPPESALLEVVSQEFRVSVACLGPDQGELTHLALRDLLRSPPACDAQGRAESIHFARECSANMSAAIFSAISSFPSSL